ncbi:MAG: hypothetical protein NC121_12985 [Blautia sp.]|nr:hypothetical protein [Blautia sp.]
MQILIFPLPPLHSTTSSPPFPLSFSLFLSQLSSLRKKLGKLQNPRKHSEHRLPPHPLHSQKVLPEDPSRKPQRASSSPAILHTPRKEEGRRCLKTPYLWAFREVEGRKKIPEREKENGLELLAGGALGWRGGGQKPQSLSGHSRYRAAVWKRGGGRWGKGRGGGGKEPHWGYPARLSLLLIFSSSQEKLKFAFRKIWFCKNNFPQCTTVG